MNNSFPEPYQVYSTYFFLTLWSLRIISGVETDLVLFRVN
jgi:hypothetical protein